jgi:hypothetical protein
MSSAISTSRAGTSRIQHRQNPTTPPAIARMPSTDRTPGGKCRSSQMAAFNDRGSVCFQNRRIRDMAIPERFNPISRDTKHPKPEKSQDDSWSAAAR